VGRSAVSRQTPLVSFAYREGIAVLAELRDMTDDIQSKETGLALARHLHRDLEGEVAPMTVSIGIGRTYEDPLQIAQAYREAHHCITLGRCIFGPNRVTHFDELGPYRVFSKCGDIHELSVFVADALGRVERYDEEHDTELLKSLACFLECGGSLKVAASKLYIHVNTLKYRLKRAEKLACVDLADHQARFNLELALRIREYISSSLK